MSDRETALCACPKCQKDGTKNVGNYVHPTTKWRHEKKARKNYKLGINREEGINRSY
jgi:hypothetical protein